MLSRIASFRNTAAREHRWAQQALPWLVNRTLSAPDAQRLRAHLAACDDCRRQLELERTLAQRLAPARIVPHAPQAAYARLAARIDADAARRTRQGWRWPFARGDARRPPRRPPFFALAIAAQAAAIAALALSLAWLVRAPEREAPYRTLASTPPAAAHLQVVFAEASTSAEVQAALARVHGRIVAGPSEAGVVLVAIEPPPGEAPDLAAAERALAAEPSVVFVAAQPAAAAGGGPNPASR